MCSTASRLQQPNPFELTATGVLGDQRYSMLGNELHHRNDLAKCKKRGYVGYPGLTFRYGMPYPPKDYGVAEAMRWPSDDAIVFNNKTDKSQKPMPPDFIRINRAAVDSGLVTSREINAFRMKNDIRLKPPAKVSRKLTPVRTFPPDMVFGQTVRPSTPIQELLEYKYQDAWIDQQRRLLQARNQQAQVKRMAPGSYKENYTSQLRRCHTQVPVEDDPLWHLPKFTRSACTHLDTFRSEAAREKAFEHHQHDSLGRSGILGQGIYQI